MLAAQSSKKYLFGNEGYLELFSTKGHEYATVGGVGIGFITFRSADTWRVREEWQRHTSNTVWTDTSYSEKKGVKRSWYYSAPVSIA
jgi:hypothetical protein